MAQIVSRTYEYVPKQALLLAGDEWLRPLQRLGDWTRIRLGMLAAVRIPSGYTGNIYDGTFLMSLVSGRTNTASSFACDNALGVSLAGTAAGSSVRNWAYTANAGNPYYALTGTSAYFYRRYTNPYAPTSQVYVLSTVLGTSTYILPVAGVGIRKRRFPFVLDISKAPLTGVYSFNLYWPNTGTEDFRPDQLMDAVDQPGTPIVAGLTWIASGVQTVSASEMTGPLDTFSIYWGRQTFPLELSAAFASLLQDAGTPQASYPSSVGAWDYFVGAPSGTLSNLASGKGWGGNYTSAGSANVASVVALSGSSSESDEPFAQYTAGTALANTINAGTNWNGPLVIAGTYSNPQALSAVTTTSLTPVYGTSCGAHDAFEQYTTGSIATMNAGTNWAAPFYAQYFVGTTYPNDFSQAGLAGTSCGFPWDSFETATPGTITILSGGTGWGSYGTIYAF